LTEVQEKVTSVRDRLAGYRAALEEADVPYDDKLVHGPQMLTDGKLSFDLVLEHLTRIPDPVTAVFGINDKVIWMVMQAATKLELSMPRDLQLAGFFDAVVPHGVRTPFIRVAQSLPGLGQAAARLLLDRISGVAPAGPQHIEVSPTVME
jgi:LacI family transcriptional regulator